MQSTKLPSLQDLLSKKFPFSSSFITHRASYVFFKSWTVSVVLDIESFFKVTLKTFKLIIFEV